MALSKYERPFEKNRSRVILSEFIKPYFQHQHLALDIGSCDGFYADLIKPLVKRIFCLDMCQDSLIPLRQKGLETVLADINYAAPFKNESFDIVIALELIEHLDNREMFIYEMYRVLKKGGYLLISTPNRCSLEAIYKKTLGVFNGKVWNAWDESHRHIFSPGEIRQLLSQKFQIIKSVGYYFLPKTRLTPSGLSFVSLNNSFLSSFCFITNIFCQKL